MLNSTRNIVTPSFMVYASLLENNDFDNSLMYFEDILTDLLDKVETGTLK